ncbi:MAG: AMP-binding protein [Proteobacteria bacterium]|nr:AMP-binding protein [Pseudomonadota bacterium]
MDLGTAFDATVARDPLALAYVDGETRKTFAEWQDDVRRVAGGLRARGLGRGDHLVVLMPNRYEMAVLYWACQMLAAIFTPFNWRATKDEIAYVLGDAEAKLAVFDSTSGDAVVAAGGLAGIDRASLLSVDEDFALLVTSAPVSGPARAAESDICLMLYTSGTTGRPKGVPRSHGAEGIAAASVMAHLGYRFGESQLGVMPLFHTMGIRILLCSTLLNGTFVNMRAFDAGKALDLIEAENIRSVFLVPTMFHDMLGRDDFDPARCRSLRTVAYAGMAMTGSLERRCAEAFNPEVFANYYGSSEIFTFTICDHLDAKPGCAGRAGLNQVMRVVRADADGRARPDEILPTGEIGEVIATMASPEAFTGYWKRPDADARAIRDGWYFTGDLGYRDEDGELFLCGRIDDMIISGAENIHPEEIEDVLAECDLVARAAVVGLPDERWGQKVVAFIEPTGALATAVALDAHCRASTLARFKRPKAYVFVDRIPTSASGKLLRRFLRDGAYDVLPCYDGTL